MAEKRQGIGRYRPAMNRIMKKAVKMEKLLILGASGFTGHHLIEFLCGSPEKKYEVHAVDQCVPDAIPGGCAFHAIDARDEASLVEILASVRPDRIINLIGALNADSWEEYYDLNVSLTQKLLEAILRLSLTDAVVLLIGSAAEYGYPKRNPLSEDDELRPVNQYGLSKVMQTQLARYYSDVRGLKIVIARTFNVTGNGVSSALSVGSFARQIAMAKDGEKIAVGNLETERDFLSIREVVGRYLFLLDHGAPGAVYNICSGKPKRMRELVEEMIAESGKRLELVVDPARFKSNDVKSIYGDSGRFDELKKTIEMERR